MNAGMMLLAGVVPDGRVFGLDQQTLIHIGIQLFNACVLAVALGAILYKPVQEFMRKRSDRIRDQIRDAQETMLQADQLKTKYEHKLSQIEAERIRILEAARHEAAQRGRHIIDEAKEEAAVIKHRAAQSIAEESERLKEETRLHIIEVSALMAGKFVEQTIDREAQDKLFNQTMAQLEEAQWPN